MPERFPSGFTGRTQKQKSLQGFLETLLDGFLKEFMEKSPEEFVHGS